MGAACGRRRRDGAWIERVGIECRAEIADRVKIALRKPAHFFMHFVAYRASTRV
jgi:hypothetical protein